MSVRIWRMGTGLACIVWLLAVSCRADVQRDIEYGEAGGERLLLDVSVPEGKGPFPIAILVHGGGWSGGDKSGSTRPGDGADISPWFETLDRAGFVWFSINYRLAPKHRWPACYEDVKTAIAWVKARAREYKGDPQRIVLFGHSAGGHLVMHVATEGAKDAPVQAVVGFAPVTDLLSDSERRGGLSLSLQNLFGFQKEITEDARRVLVANSPVTHVSREMPPVLIVHGDGDKTVPIGMAEAFMAKLKETGVPAEMIVRPGVPHSLVAGEKIDGGVYKQRMLEWIEQAFEHARSGNSGTTK